MKIPICISCQIPLKIKNGFARFRCMCDEDIRMIPLEYLGKHSDIKYLDINEAKELFLHSFLTTSQNLVE